MSLDYLPIECDDAWKALIERELLLNQGTVVVDPIIKPLDFSNHLFCGGHDTLILDKQIAKAEEQICKSNLKYLDMLNPSWHLLILHVSSARSVKTFLFLIVRLCSTLEGAEKSERAY